MQLNLAKSVLGNCTQLYSTTCKWTNYGLFPALWCKSSVDIIVYLPPNKFYISFDTKIESKCVNNLQIEVQVEAALTLWWR